jgi:hypothetical protein
MASLMCAIANILGSRDTVLCSIIYAINERVMYSRVTSFFKRNFGKIVLAYVGFMT